MRSIEHAYDLAHKQNMYSVHKVSRGGALDFDIFHFTIPKYAPKNILAL